MGPELLTLTISSISTDMLERVKGNYANDVDYTMIIHQLERGNRSTLFSYMEGLLRINGKIVVGNDVELRKDILELFHGSTLGGHSGVSATLQREIILLIIPSIIHKIPQTEIIPFQGEIRIGNKYKSSLTIKNDGEKY